MNICFFGSYDPDYSRNQVLIDGLNKNGFGIFYCRSTQGLFLTRYWSLTAKFWKIRNKVDVIYVAFVGQLNMPLAFILGHIFHKKVIFDMFYSMYDTYVFDRQSAAENSFRARIYYWIDKVAAQCADIIITDTKSHAIYFNKIFSISADKFKRLFVGGNETIFYPEKKLNRKLIVEFHGFFTRLSGAEYFVEAAKMLEQNKNIELWLIGNSDVYKEPLSLLEKLKPKNLKIFNYLNLDELASKVRQADVTVGHLGNTNKSLNVISNKTYHGLASGNVLIVINSPANKELLQDKKTCIFVKPADAGQLAQKILELVKNKALVRQLQKNAFMLHQSQLTNQKIVTEFRKILFLLV